MATAKTFEELQIPQKQTAEISGKYKIYSASGECVDIAANTVLEALELSGVKDPVKVERAMLSAMGIIDRSVLATPPAAEAAAAAAAATVTPPATPAAT